MNSKISNHLLSRALFSIIFIPRLGSSATVAKPDGSPVNYVPVVLTLTNNCRKFSQVTIEYQDASGAYSACLISAEKSSAATCEAPAGKLNWSASTFIYPRQYTVHVPAENPAQMDVTFGPNCSQFDMAPSSETNKGGKPGAEPVAMLYGIPVYDGQAGSPHVFTPQEIAVMDTTLAPIPLAYRKRIKKIISQLPFGDKAHKDFEFTTAGTLILYLPDLKYRLKNSGGEYELTFSKIENAFDYVVGASAFR